MTNIDGLYGYNRAASDVDILFAAYGNDIVNTTTEKGYSQNISSGNKAEFATYLDYCFFVNGEDETRSFNGDDWSVNGKINRAPIAKYIRLYGTRLYLGNIKVNDQSYPSRVWYSDLPHNNEPRWGIEWGDDLAQTAGSAVITSDSAYFENRGIKTADPVWILDGANAGEYTVETVDSEHQITLTEELSQTAASGSFIVGSNYFDVRTDDNETITGLGENSNRLLCFKINSLYRYNGSSLLRVKGAPGTTSGRSIVNIRNYTFYFHGAETQKTGIYVYDGTEAAKASSKIQPYIEGIETSMYPKIVSWREGDTYRCYVGDITNDQRGIDVEDAVLSYDVPTDKWSVDPFKKVVKCSATFIENNVEQVFLGDNNAEVFRTPTGYSFDDSPISWVVETGVKYPLETERMLKFKRIQVISRDALGVRVRYKLYNDPSGIDHNWQPLGEISGDKTQFTVPKDHSRASGINIRLEETGVRENTQYIERISVIYEYEGTKFI